MWGPRLKRKSDEQVTATAVSPQWEVVARLQMDQMVVVAS
jgi:hypothetical protein